MPFVTSTKKKKVLAVRPSKPFDCPICWESDVQPSEGVIISEYCNHIVCRDCTQLSIQSTVGDLWTEMNYVYPFRCPVPDCLVPVEYHSIVLPTLKQSKKLMDVWKAWCKERAYPRAKYLTVCPRRRCCANTSGSGGGTMRYVSHHDTENVVYCEDCKVVYCESCLFRYPVDAYGRPNNGRNSIDTVTHHTCTNLPPFEVCRLCIDYVQATTFSSSSSDEANIEGNHRSDTKFDKYRRWLPSYAIGRFSELGPVDTLFYYWMGTTLAKFCPDCGTAIEKNGGCNHMICLHCGCHFCYGCGSSWSDECSCGRRR